VANASRKRVVFVVFFQGQAWVSIDEEKMTCKSLFKKINVSISWFLSPDAFPVTSTEYRDHLLSKLAGDSGMKSFIQH